MGDPHSDATDRNKEQTDKMPKSAADTYWYNHGRIAGIRSERKKSDVKRSEALQNMAAEFGIPADTMQSALDDVNAMAVKLAAKTDKRDETLQDVTPVPPANQNPLQSAVGAKADRPLVALDTEQLEALQSKAFELVDFIHATGKDPDHSTCVHVHDIVGEMMAESRLVIELITILADSFDYFDHTSICATHDKGDTVENCDCGWYKLSERHIETATRMAGSRNLTPLYTASSENGGMT